MKTLNKRCFSSIEGNESILIVSLKKTVFFGHEFAKIQIKVEWTEIIQFICIKISIYNKKTKQKIGERERIS